MALRQATPVQHFDPQRFDKLIEDHGTPALWQRARYCPCFDSSTGQPRVNCPLCSRAHGIPGILWAPATPTMVFAPSRGRKDEYDLLGAWMQGMLMMTFPTGKVPGHLDRIDLLKGVMVVNNEFHVRGELDPLGRSTERLRLGHALSIQDCLCADGENGEILREFVEGEDFLANYDNGDIIWADGRGPAEGTRYSMRYAARPSFVCLSPQSRDEGGTQQVYRSLFQRLDFFRRPSVGEA